MKLLYFDCPAGISGDMTLGALLDLGIKETALRAGIAGLGLEGEYELNISKAQKRGVTGTQVKVKLSHDHHAVNDHEHHHHHHHRNLPDIVALIEGSELKQSVKEKAIAMFNELARAEGKVHGVSPQEVHFHEVGAVDSIVDIVGVCIAMDMLDADRVVFSPLNTGSGQVRCQHGLMPVPAPATAELLIGLQSYSDGTMSELTTPTGALVARLYADEFGPLPKGTVERIGYGLGFKDFDFPNCLRVLLLNVEQSEAQHVVLLSCNIDDMTGEAAGYALQRLLDAGALDAWFTPIYMKKNRPAYELTALCSPEGRSAVERSMLTETTTLGLRAIPAGRTTLPRQTETVETPWGNIRVKVAQSPTGVKVSPEYEDCRAIAERENLPFLTVYAKAQSLAQQKS